MNTIVLFQPIGKGALVVDIFIFLHLTSTQNSSYFRAPLKSFLALQSSWKINFTLIFPFFFHLPCPTFPSSCVFEMKGNVSSSLSKIQSVADPSSERDYPSIFISHTLIIHVSLWSFVSATLYPEWRDSSLLVDWEVLTSKESRISRLRKIAFHRLAYCVML